MYMVDVLNKSLVQLKDTSFSSIGIRERFDVQEWIEGSPELLGEELLIIAKELILPTGKRLDLLAVDRRANLVIVELKRDDSGGNVEMQAIKYASYISNFTAEDIFKCYATKLKSDENDAQIRVEEFVDNIEALNQTQRIILVARDFQPEVASAVLWLRDNYQVDITCIRLRTYTNRNGDLFITPDIIIPLPEAKDYIERREVKQRDTRQGISNTFSLEVGNYELDELEQRIRTTLGRDTELTPRLVAFIEILLSEERAFRREEIKVNLLARGIGVDLGQSGRYLSGVSQFLTKIANSHLRQVIGFATEGGLGQVKDQYQVNPDYREFLRSLIDERKTY